LESFVAETAKNFAALGAWRALTGPIVRGDWATLHQHQAALRELAPDLLPLYRELNRGMLKIAGRNSRPGVWPRRLAKTATVSAKRAQNDV
jgi:predicted short-subunit dehydrogenase-like oxidoreductase (DUF2520 family)